MDEERYARNGVTITPEETRLLHDRHVAVIGCGGLGGYLVEMLGRLGVGHIRAVDGDVFDTGNLNRQLLCTEDKIGCSKALAARERMKAVNSRVSVEAMTSMLTRDNAAQILDGMDLVLDALDSLEIRLLLQEAAAQAGIPLVHGAIGGWYGRVTTVFPGDDTLTRLYGGKKGDGAEKLLGNPSFTPALVAAVQVSEAVKVLLDKGQPLRNQYLYIDLLNDLFRVMEV